MLQLLAFLLMMLAAPAVHAVEPINGQSYEDLFTRIVQDYSNGFSGNPFEDEGGNRSIFWNFSDQKLLFKLAAESDVRSFHFEDETYLLIQPNYRLWTENKNILRDKFGNGDFYVVQVDQDNFTLIGRMHQYKTCKESISKQKTIQFTCLQNNEKIESIQIKDIYEWDHKNFSKTDSNRFFKKTPLKNLKKF